MRVRKLFYSKQDKLFAIWRLLRLLIITIPIVIIGYQVFNLFKLDFSYGGSIAKMIFIVGIILITIFLDKEKIQDLGIEFKWISIIYFIIGIIWAYFFNIQFQIVSAAKSDSAFHFINPFTRDTILSLVYYIIFIGLSEELMFRGYIISNIKRDSNYLVALIVSSILFSLIHLGSGESIMSIFIMGTVMTLFFGLIFIMTKNIFLVVGLHGAWDAFGRLFHQIFREANMWPSTKLIVVVINLIIFYFLFSKSLNFKLKSLIQHGS
jgi:uncharacterized protein